MPRSHILFSPINTLKNQKSSKTQSRTPHRSAAETATAVKREHSTNPNSPGTAPRRPELIKSSQDLLATKPSGSSVNEPIQPRIGQYGTTPCYSFSNENSVSSSTKHTPGRLVHAQLEPVEQSENPTAGLTENSSVRSSLNSGASWGVSQDTNDSESFHPISQPTPLAQSLQSRATTQGTAASFVAVVRDVSNKLHEFIEDNQEKHEDMVIKIGRVENEVRRVKGGLLDVKEEMARVTEICHTVKEIIQRLDEMKKTMRVILGFTVDEVSRVGGHERKREKEAKHRNEESPHDAHGTDGNASIWQTENSIDMEDLENENEEPGTPVMQDDYPGHPQEHYFHVARFPDLSHISEISETSNITTKIEEMMENERERQRGKQFEVEHEPHYHHSHLDTRENLYDGEEGKQSPTNSSFSPLKYLTKDEEFVLPDLPSPFHDEIDGSKALPRQVTTQGHLERLADTSRQIQVQLHMNSETRFGKKDEGKKVSFLDSPCRPIPASNSIASSPLQTRKSPTGTPASSWLHTSSPQKQTKRNSLTMPISPISRIERERLLEGSLDEEETRRFQKLRQRLLADTQKLLIENAVTPTDAVGVADQTPVSSESVTEGREYLQSFNSGSLKVSPPIVENPQDMNTPNKTVAAVPGLPLTLTEQLNPTNLSSKPTEEVVESDREERSFFSNSFMVGDEKIDILVKLSKGTSSPNSTPAAPLKNGHREGPVTEFERINKQGQMSSNLSLTPEQGVKTGTLPSTVTTRKKLLNAVKGAKNTACVMKETEEGSATIDGKKQDDYSPNLQLERESIKWKEMKPPNFNQPELRTSDGRVTTVLPHTQPPYRGTIEVEDVEDGDGSNVSDTVAVLPYKIMIDEESRKAARRSRAVKTELQDVGSISPDSGVESGRCGQESKQNQELKDWLDMYNDEMEVEFEENAAEGREVEIEGNGIGEAECEGSDMTREKSERVQGDYKDLARREIESERISPKLKESKISGLQADFSAQVENPTTQEGTTSELTDKCSVTSISMLPVQGKTDRESHSEGNGEDPLYTPILRSENQDDTDRMLERKITDKRERNGKRKASKMTELSDTELGTSSRKRRTKSDSVVLRSLKKTIGSPISKTEQKKECNATEDHKEVTDPTPMISRPSKRKGNKKSARKTKSDVSKEALKVDSVVENHSERLTSEHSISETSSMSRRKEKAKNTRTKTKLALTKGQEQRGIEEEEEEMTYDDIKRKRVGGNVIGQTQEPSLPPETLQTQSDSNLNIDA